MAYLFYRMRHWIAERRAYRAWAKANPCLVIENNVPIRATLPRKTFVFPLTLRDCTAYDPASGKHVELGDLTFNGSEPWL